MSRSERRQLQQQAQQQQPQAAAEGADQAQQQQPAEVEEQTNEGTEPVASAADPGLDPDPGSLPLDHDPAGDPDGPLEDDGPRDEGPAIENPGARLRREGFIKILSRETSPESHAVLQRLAECLPFIQAAADASSDDLVANILEDFERFLRGA